MSTRTQTFLASCFASGALTMLGLLLFVPNVGLAAIACTTLVVVAASGLLSYFWQDLPTAVRAVPGAFRVAMPTVTRELCSTTKTTASWFAERGRRFSRLFFRSRPLFQIPAAVAISGWAVAVHFGISRLTLLSIPWSHPMTQTLLIVVPIVFGLLGSYGKAYEEPDWNDTSLVNFVFIPSLPICALYGIVRAVGYISNELIDRTGAKWRPIFFETCFACDDRPHYEDAPHSRLGRTNNFTMYDLPIVSWRRGLAYYGDALANIGIGLGWLCCGIVVGLAWYLPRAIARFVAYLFFTIHTAERLMVSVDGPLGGLVAYAGLRLALGVDLRALPVVFQLGFVALGGCAARAIGYFNHSLIARGLLKLSPVSLSAPPRRPLRANLPFALSPERAFYHLTVSRRVIYLSLN